MQGVQGHGAGAVQQVQGQRLHEQLLRLQQQQVVGAPAVALRPQTQLAVGTLTVVLSARG